MDRETKALLAAAAGCVALFVMLLGLAYGWDPARSLDLHGLEGFMSANQGPIDTLSWAATQAGDPRQVALAALVLAALAVVRGRPRVALLVLVFIAATSVSGQLLKELLAHPRPQPAGANLGLGPEAFPSGHATAVMSLALACVLAAPRRARPAAALLGSLPALATGAAVVANGGHYPSDVLGGYLLASAWALALVAAFRVLEARLPQTDRWSRTSVARLSERLAGRGLEGAAVLCALAALVASVILVATDPEGVASFARDNTAAVVLGLGVALAALALPAGLVTLARRTA